MDPNMVRLEGVRMMEREAEAERKRLELVSPQEKPQEQPSVQVNNQIITEQEFSRIFLHPCCKVSFKILFNSKF